MTNAQKAKVAKIAVGIIDEAPKRSAIKDGREVKVLSNQSEALGVIGREVGGLTEEVAEVLLPLAEKGEALDTMRRFLLTLARGPEVKAPTVKKSELASMLAEAQAKLAAAGITV